MAHQQTESKIQALQDLSAAQVAVIVERTGLSREEVAQQLGCGTSQLFKYEKEGLPPRMNRAVRAAILQLGIDTGVLADNALTRATISKLAKEA
jgi:DNA-binding transcriptional regulator YiaG